MKSAPLKWIGIGLMLAGITTLTVLSTGTSALWVVCILPVLTLKEVDDRTARRRGLWILLVVGTLMVSASIWHQWAMLRFTRNPMSTMIWFQLKRSFFYETLLPTVGVWLGFVGYTAGHLLENRAPVSPNAQSTYQPSR